MNSRVIEMYGALRKGIIFSIIFCSIIFSITAASAADKTYYWIPSSGAISSSGFTANWGSCNAQPTSYKVTALSSTGFTCNSDRLTTTSEGDQFLAVFPTAYGSDTQITGKVGATFYLSSQRSGYTATYRFDLGYAQGGTFTSLGNVTQAVSSSKGQKYTIDMSSISGTSPSGSYPALKVSVTTNRGGRVDLGTNGSTSGSNSGRFYVSETDLTTPTPIPTTPTPTPTTPPAGYSIKVSTDRYSIFAPWVNKASDTSLSANFTGYALLLDENGRPISGQGITFKIYSGGGSILKGTKTAITQANGLASVSYDTFNDFSISSDNDYGKWKIEAYLTNNPSVIGSTNMNIEAGGKAAGGCGQDNCHKTNTASGNKPRSPYTDGYGQTSTRATAAHKKSNHQNAGCPACHPGYASDKTATGTDGKPYGKTGDVHSSRTCEFCHGNWSYITGTGNGIPKMPSCYDCHPVFNNNLSNISTLANLAAGNGISVFSFNYDQKKPLAAHTGTMYSLVDSIPCITCHGPAHNNSKPYVGSGSSNGITENEQCWTCHSDRATTHKSNTNCVSCHSQNAHNISTAGGGPDCRACHDAGGSAPRLINFSAAGSSAHKNLNIAASSTVNAENKKCWACHGDGAQPDGHPSGYKTPSPCENCHTGAGKYSEPLVREHIQSGNDVQTAAACILCHDNNGMYLDGGGIGTVTHYLKDVTDTSTVPYGHYGSIDTSKCLDCHKGPYTADPVWGSPVNITTSSKRQHTETSNAQCDLCHKDSTISTLANVDFHHPALTAGAGGDNCVGCHAGAE